MKLEKLIDRVINQMGHFEDLEIALIACINEGGEKGLRYVIELADFDYEASTFKWYYKYPSAITATYWGEKGIELIAERALNSDLYSSRRVFLNTLCHASSLMLGDLSNHYMSRVKNLEKRLNFTEDRYHSPEFLNSTKRAIFNIATNMEPHEPVPQEIFSLVGSTITPNLEVFNVMFSALSSRWFRLNKSGLNEFNDLIFTEGILEEEVHQYLHSNPHVLEPFFSQVWSKPKLGENLIADFIIKLIDDNYCVVEIEKPSDMIVTKSGNLSAKTTHAIRQALEYREWLISNHLYAKKDYPNIWRPSCLVVIGRESLLDETQLNRLRQENESREGIVKIVGFDWLYKRAQAIHHNIINGFNRFD